MVWTNTGCTAGVCTDQNPLLVLKGEVWIRPPEGECVVFHHQILPTENPAGPNPGPGQQLIDVLSIFNELYNGCTLSLKCFSEYFQNNHHIFLSLDIKPVTAQRLYVA